MARSLKRTESVEKRLYLEAEIRKYSKVMMKEDEIVS